VSEGIRRIVDFVNATPKCTRRKLLEALAPVPKVTVIPVAPEASVPPTDPAAAPVAPAAPEPTAEQTAVISDLHWLIHQGHVIEFANGIMETAKKPLPKPPKPAKAVTKPAEQAAEAATATAETAAETATIPDLSTDEATSDLAPAPAESETAAPEPVSEASPEKQPQTTSDEPST
jgi:hypothetical protein